MKNKLKIGAILLAFTIIVLILYFGNALAGNPMSKYLVNKNAEVYIEENYGELDLIVEDAFYDFKRVNTYVVSAKSENIEDLRFSVYYDMFGNLVKDNYDNLIAGGENTMYRINMEYMRECENVFDKLEKSDTFKACESFYSSGWLWSTKEREMMSEIYGMELTGGIDAKTLELDKNYDMSELGEDAGILDLSVAFADNNVSFERGAETLREVKRVFDEENIKFKYITFGVFNEEGNFAWDAPYISYDDIERVDLEEILEEHGEKSMER